MSEDATNALLKAILEDLEWARIRKVSGLGQRISAGTGSYVEKLEAENAKLREALRPFAERADIYDPPEGDDDIRDWSEGPPHTHILIGDLRRARSAVKGNGND